MLSWDNRDESPWTARAEAELIETTLESRDGALWVDGVCSNCWTRVAVRMLETGAPDRADCPEGHVLHVVALHSARAQPSPLLLAIPFDEGSRSMSSGGMPTSHRPPHPATPERRDPHVGQSQPDASNWDLERPYIGPPEEGQPRMGSRVL